MKDSDKKMLMQFLDTLDKEELLEMCSKLFTTSDFEDRRRIFGSFFHLKLIENLKDDIKAFFFQLQEFHANSLNGEYLDDKWGWDGKYDKITTITQLWYDEITQFLDAVCEFYLDGDEQFAFLCLSLGQTHQSIVRK